MINKVVSAKKSELLVRTIAAIVMTIVSIGVIFLGGWPFRLLVWLVAGLMLVEYGDMYKIRRLWVYTGVALLALNLLAIPNLIPDIFAVNDAANGAGSGLVSWGYIYAAGMIAPAALMLGIASRDGRLTLGYLYVAIPTLALLALGQISDELVLWAMIVTWSTDIFAYFAGRSLGGPKFAPKISPNKTWAGLIGGMAGAALAGAIMAIMFSLDSIFLYAGAPMAVLAQLGDLYESSLKRGAGVKDSGTILPGHGGILDRVDGLVVVVTATLILVIAGA